MLKKWLHIVLSVWLINSVTYFHGSNTTDLFSPVPEQQTTDEECVHINTWTDCLGHLMDDDDDIPEKAHKIKSPRRYVRLRNAGVKALLFSPPLKLTYKYFRSAVAGNTSNYSIGVALRPAYYAFLFRLCPF